MDARCEGIAVLAELMFKMRKAMSISSQGRMSIEKGSISIQNVSVCVCVYVPLISSHLNPRGIQTFTNYLE